MTFKRNCCCPRHKEWGFGVVPAKDLFRPTYHENKFCGTGKWKSSHRERKEKSCKFCRERIELQRKFESLEVSTTSKRNFSLE